MEKFYNSLCQFLLTNTEPMSHKIAVSLTVVFIFSTLTFFVSCIVNRLRGINLLNLNNYGLINLFYWVTGSVVIDFILITTKILNYNIVSFLIVSMVWDSIYQRLFKQVSSQNTDISSVDTIDSTK